RAAPARWWRGRRCPARAEPAARVALRYGYDDSTVEQTTSSRTAHPGGCDSAKRTVAATCAGSFSGASGGGLYLSSRASKNAVRMPPGMSSVTPTSPASSAASARVKPTTPNFAAQYAVASLTALMPTVDAAVTTAPPLAVRHGTVAPTAAAAPRTVAAPPRRHS